jgi:hypothetical protein
MFTAHLNRGFLMTFKNGWTISVQFGYGNYCGNHHHPDGLDFSIKQDSTTCPDAEIAIWDENGVWYDFGNDIVKGHCTADQVADWITRVSKAQKRIVRPRVKKEKAK